MREDGTVVLLAAYDNGEGFLLGAQKPLFKGQIENKDAQSKSNFWVQLDIDTDALFAAQGGGGIAVADSRSATSS